MGSCRRASLGIDQLSPLRKTSKEAWVLHNEPLFPHQMELYYSGRQRCLRFLMDGRHRERKLQLTLSINSLMKVIILPAASLWVRYLHDV